MNEIRVLKISGEGGSCFFCAINKATRIVGNDYDICESDECLEYATEKKRDDNTYYMRRRHEVMGQMRYEGALNK